MQREAECYHVLIFEEKRREENISSAGIIPIRKVTSTTLPLPLKLRRMTDLNQLALLVLSCHIHRSCSAVHTLHNWLLTVLIR